MSGARPQTGLRVMLLTKGAGLFLYVRLPDQRRLLIDLSTGPSSPPFDLLKKLGELGPVTPISQYLKPCRQKPDMELWLGLISLVRGLALKPGGSRIYWRPRPAVGGGFVCRARVTPLKRRLPAREGQNPPLLVLGLDLPQIMALNGGPASWVANASLALRLEALGPESSPLLLGGDLLARAWERLLAPPGASGLLAGVSWYLAGKPARGFDLARGVLMSALPWLVLGALCTGPWPARPLAGGGGRRLSTPALGLLVLDADRRGRLTVRGRTWAENRIFYQGLVRPVGDMALPPPWPVQRALASPA